MGKDLKGKELGVGISQRKDGRYEARAKIDNQKIHLYNMNLNELKRDFEKEKDRVKRKQVTSYPEITLNDWFNAWFEQYKKPTLKPTGVNAYKRKFVNTYGKLLGNLKVKELNQFAIQQATASLVEEKYTSKTIRDALSTLKICLECAIANLMIEINPCAGVIVPGYTEVKEERRVLTKEEQKRFLEYTDNSFYRELYRFMLLTGVRVGEMGALTWEDIDFENGFIYISHSLTCMYENGKKTLCVTTPKTKNSYRKIPFFGETKAILIAQKKKQEQLKQQLKDRWRGIPELGNLVFCTSMGSPVTRYALEHDMKTISKQINLVELCNANAERREAKLFEPIYPHALRHTFATRCFEKGMTTATVQKIMGHANISVTMSYTHVLEDVMKKEANNVGDFLDV